MTRTRRTTALIAAAALALGVTACSPPNEKESDNTTVVTEVTPDPGYEGAGKATTSGEAEADDEAEAEATDENGAPVTEGAEGAAIDGTGVAEGTTAVEGGEPAEAPAQ